MRNDFRFGRIGRKSVSGKYGTVVGSVGFTEFRRHCERIVKIGEGTIGIKRTRVKNRLGGSGDIFNAEVCGGVFNAEARRRGGTQRFF